MRFLSLKIFLLLVFTVAAGHAIEADRKTAVLLVLGDSLTAGYGLAQEDSFPAQLKQRLLAAGHHVEVINAGVSGDTTAGALARLEWSLSDQADLVIVELGANDALRGLDPATTYENLDRIVRRLKASGSDLLLAGMRAPRNLGSDYYTKFDRIYPDLAERHGLLFYPFFLEGVALQPHLNQQDGIHPNAAGVQRIVDGIAPMVASYLRDRDGSGSVD